MSNAQNDIIAENNDETRQDERAIWLKTSGLTEGDVLEEDDDKGEFVWSEEENGTVGEDGYGFDHTKCYLPKELQRK